MWKNLGRILGCILCLSFLLFVHLGQEGIAVAGVTPNSEMDAGAFTKADMAKCSPYENKNDQAKAVSSRSMQATGGEIVYEAQSTAEDYINWGWYCYSNGYYEQGIIYFTNAINLNSDYLTDAYDGRGWCKHDLGRYDDAIVDFTTAISYSSYNYDAFAGRADCYYLKNEYTLAVQDFSSAINLDGTFEWYYSERGWCYYELNDYDKAIADYTTALGFNSKNAAYYYEARGWCYYEKEKYDSAKADFTAALGLDSGRLYSLSGRAWCNYELELYDAGITDFNNAIGLDPSNSDLLYGKALCYYDKGDYTNALAAFNATIAIEAWDWPYYYRGQCYLALFQPADAIDDFTSAIELDNKWVDAYNARGWAYLELRQYDNAIDDFTAAIENGMTWDGVYANRGWANYYGGYVGDALQDFQSIIDSEYGKLSRSELCFLLAYNLNLAPVTTPANKFSDVAPNSFNGQAVYAVKQAGLVDGYPDGTFLPYNTVTRAELAKILVSAFNLTIKHPATPSFSDVSTNYWAYSYIETVCSAGFMYGYADRTFSPDDEVAIVDAINAFVKVKQSSIAGDLDKNGVVDIKDLAAMALAYGTANSNADLNGDGIVDIFDLVLLCKKL